MPFVGPDNRAGAHAVGLALAPRWRAASKVAILEGIPTAFNAQQRRLGFEDAMREAGMTVVGAERALGAGRSRCRSRPRCCVSTRISRRSSASNDNMALGAAAAVRQGQPGRWSTVVGFDHIAAVQQLLKEGRIVATADQHGDKLAVYGIEYTLGILKGETTPQDRQTPVDMHRGAGMSVLRLRGLGKRYAAPVLADVDLDLAAGEVHALMGANGAGKSTLSKIVSGLVAADTGAMHLAGEAYRPRTRREAPSAPVSK